MSLFVCVTKPGYERVAARHMQRRGVMVFVPTSRHFRRAGSKLAAHDRPLLYGYVFAWSDDADRDHEAIRHADGVMDILAMSDGARLRAERWVGAVLVLQSFGMFDKTLTRRPSWSIGQMVRVIATVWAGVTGKVVKVDGATITVDLQGKHVHGPKAFDASAIEAAAKAA